MNSTTEIELNLKRFPLHSQASNVSAMLDYLHYCTGSPAYLPVKQPIGAVACQSIKKETSSPIIKEGAAVLLRSKYSPAGRSLF